MQWNFPVASGTHLEVRLYFINQYGGTSGVGQRVFNVAIDGNTVLNNYDIVADVGDRVGTMKSFNITSDGNVNIDFSHLTENTLINGIEIVNTDIAPVPASPVDWSDVRGMTLANGKLYFARTNGNLYSMDFANGAPVRGTEALVSPKSDGYDWASNGLFAFSHVAVDTDPPTAPGKPTGSSPATGTITINWPASTDASPPITYRIYRDGTQVGTTTSSTSFTDTDPVNLTAGSSHTYTVDAIDSLNNPPSQMSPTSDPIVVAATPPVVFSDDFSSGDFSNWTGVTRLTIDNSTGGVAPPSARGAVSAQTAFAYKTLSSPLNTICVSANVNVAVRDAGSTTLLMLRTPGNGPIVRVFVDPNGILYLRSDASNTQIWSGVALGSGWHSIEVCGTVGVSSSWDLYRDGSTIATLGSPTPGRRTVGRVNIGNTQAVTATVNFDDVVVDQPNLTPDTDPPTAPGKPTGSSPAPGRSRSTGRHRPTRRHRSLTRIYRDGTQVGTTTSSTSFTDTDPVNLTAGSSHTYTVDAIDSLNNPPSQMSPTSDPIVVAATPPVVFSDDFSSGDFSNWTGVTRLTIDNSTGGVAPPSARGAVSAQTAFAYKTLSSPLNTICVSANVNVAVRDAGSTTLLMLRTPGNGPIVRVFVDPNGILYLRSDASNTQIWSGVALGSGWHSIEVCGTVGVSSSWDLSRDGSTIATLVANTGTTDVGRVNIGNTQAVTATVNFDDVVVDQTPG